MKLTKRTGDFRIYSSDKGNIEVKLCLNPNLYVVPGYYLTFSNSVPKEILTKRYSNGLQAAKAAYNSISN
jgi:hypothetical protein